MMLGDSDSPSVAPTRVLTVALHTRCCALLASFITATGRSAAPMLCSPLTMPAPTVNE